MLSDKFLIRLSYMGGFSSWTGAITESARGCGKTEWQSGCLGIGFRPLQGEGDAGPANLTSMTMNL